MKTVIIVAIFGLISLSSKAQTYATNFTTDDCDGTSHTLFDELDEGKVIVIGWTMPCFSCIGPLLSAHDAVGSFDATNPGEVLFYLVDDYNDTDCGTVESWGVSNGFIKTDAFFASDDIKMSDYGLDGMPKVVVLACSSHKVFLNKNDFISYDEVHDAIEMALSSDGCFLELDNPSLDLGLEIYPNPATDVLNISFVLNEPASTTIEIFNSAGSKVKTVFTKTNLSGTQNHLVELTDLAPGFYSISITTDQQTEIRKFIVSR